MPPTRRNLLWQGASLIGSAVPTSVFASVQALHVVELFQSQGCSSCPPANANLLELMGRSDLICLSFGVTYWDHLGWKDTFAAPEFTARQWAYARAFGRTNVFTPQVVVNGARDTVGASMQDLQATLRATPPLPGDIQLHATATEISLSGALPATPLDVWRVSYDPSLVQIPVRSGENGGKTLPHRNVVRDLTRLVPIEGKASSWKLPGRSRSGLKEVILAQDRGRQRILAAFPRA